MTNKEKFIETFKQTPDDSICPVYCSDDADGSKCPYLKSSWCDWWDMEYKVEQEPVLDKIRAEIVDCLKALDEIEKSGLNIYLPNEMSGRRLTYQQCLEFIDKYKAEQEAEDGSN